MEPVLVEVMRSCRSPISVAGWLVTDGGGHTAKKRRDLGTGLGETEDVVDEQQHILTAIAEVLSLGKAGQADAQTAPGGSFI